MGTERNHAFLTSAFKRQSGRAAERQGGRAAEPLNFQSSELHKPSGAMGTGGFFIAQPQNPLCHEAHTT